MGPQAQAILSEHLSNQAEGGEACLRFPGSHRGPARSGGISQVGVTHFVEIPELRVANGTYGVVTRCKVAEPGADRLFDRAAFDG